MFRRKSSFKGMKGRMTGKAKKAVKRLLDKPTADRLSAVAMLATQENRQPFRPQPGSGLGDIGACKAVAEAMKAVPNDLSIQTEGCRAVEALADRDGENVLRLGQAECCQLVERALGKFPNDSMLQTQGCRAVTNLFNGEGNSKQLVKRKACQLVVAALAKFPNDHEVQIEACGAIANLANNSKTNRDLLSKIGACDLVAKSMSNFPSNIDVQHAACVAVGNLANRHPENKIRLGAAGACSKVCAALIAFKDDMGVQYMGCGAVGNLSSSNPENCTKIGEGGGCLLVAAAMNAFPTDRNLQHVGCAAVANLAIGNADNAKRLVRSGARVAVQRAMDKFKDDDEIQTRGSQALRWLNNRPRRSMSQCSPGHARLAVEGKHDRRATSHVPTGKPPTPVGERGRSITKLHRGDVPSPCVPGKSLAGPHGRSLSVSEADAMIRRSRPSALDKDGPGESGPMRDRGAIQPLPRSLTTGKDSKPPGVVSKAQLEAMKRRSRSSVTNKDNGRCNGAVSTARKEAMKRRSKSLVTDTEYRFPGTARVTELEAPQRRSKSAVTEMLGHPETTVSSTPKVEQVKRRSRSVGKDSPESPEEMPMPHLEALKMRSRSAVCDKERPTTSPRATHARGRGEVVKRAGSSASHAEVFPDSQSDGEVENHSRHNVIAQARAALRVGEDAASRRSKSPAHQLGEGDFFDETASEMSISDVHGESSEDVRAIPPPSLPPAVTAGAVHKTKSVPGAKASRTPTSRASAPPSLLPRRPAVSFTGATTQSAEQRTQEAPGAGSDTDADSPVCRTSSETVGARVDDTRRNGVGHDGAMDSVPPGKVRAGMSDRRPGPGRDSAAFPASGHDKSKAFSRPDPSKPVRRSKSSELDPGADTLNRARKYRSRSSSMGESVASKATVLEATANACSHWSSTASISQPSSNGSAVGSSSAQEEKPGKSPRQLRLVTDDTNVVSATGRTDGIDPDDAVIVRRSRHHTPRSGLGRSRSQNDDVPRRYGRSNSAESISRGRVCVSPASSMQDLEMEELGDKTSESSKSAETYGSRGSSSRSTKSARRRRSLVDIIGDPTVTGAPKLAELVRTEESIIAPLMVVLGEDPVAQSGMIRNVEQLLRRSHQMEAITARVLRDELMASTSTPGQKAMRSREYFNVLYTGLCGAHVASAVITRGGIVAESKDGWLRKASALLSVISVACPLVKPGMAMLGKALQLAERPQMADNLEQIAKGSKHTHEVSSVMELAARRLVEEDRAEIPKSSLDAHRSKSLPTNEWLPAWLLEEASACGLDARSQEGPPGTDSARKTGVADGCVILETLGRRGVRKLATQGAKVEALVQAVLRKSVQWPSSTRSASSTGSFIKEEAAFRDASPNASQSWMSPVCYPPVSPTVIPSQGSMASPSGSVVGALRKGEAAGVMDAARAVAMGSTPPAVQPLERHSGTAAGQEPAVALSASQKPKDDSARGNARSNGVMEGDASAGAYGFRSDERTSEPASAKTARDDSKSDPSLAPAASSGASESPRDSRVVAGYTPPAWITERLGRVSKKEVSQETSPPAYRSESEPTEYLPKVEDREKKTKKEPGLSVGKINVPEIFRRAERTLMPPPGSAKLRRAQSVSGNGKVDSPADGLVTPARPLRDLEGSQAATTGNTIARRGRARVSAAPKPPPLDRSPSPATSASDGNGRDAQTRQVGDTKQSPPVRGSKRGGVHKQSPGRRASPRVVNARGSTPRGGTPKGGYSSGGTIKCSPRVPPVVKKSATRKASPRVSTAANGWLEEGRRTPAEARKGWGRSGSWYSPRPERLASQASPCGVASHAMASPPLAAPSPAGGGHEAPTAMNFGSFDDGEADGATASESRKGEQHPGVETQKDDTGGDPERDSDGSDGDDDDDDENLPPPSPPASLGTNPGSRGSGVKITKTCDGDGEVSRRAPRDLNVDRGFRDEGKQDMKLREDADGDLDADSSSREARVQHKKPAESNGEVAHHTRKYLASLRRSRSTDVGVAVRAPGDFGAGGNSSRGTDAEDMKRIEDDDGEISRRVAELTKNGPDSIAPSPPGYEALCVAPAAGETFLRIRMSSRSPFNSEGAGSRRSIPRTPGSKPKHGSLAERIAGLGGALRSAYRRDHSLGSNRSSWSRSRGSSEGLGGRGRKQKEQAQSPSRFSERSRSLGRKSRDGERDFSPALNRLPNGSRLSIFLSGSKFTRAKTQPSTGCDSFGSSVDETDEEDDVDERDLSCPPEDRRSSFSSSRSSRRAKSLFGNNPNRGVGRNQRKAAQREKPEEQPGFHVRANSVSDLIRRMEKRGGRQDNRTTPQRASTGQEAKSRWFLGGRK